MTRRDPRYIATRGQHGVFVEIYFPKRVAYQGVIYNTLREGFDELMVKDYLNVHMHQILDDTEEYIGTQEPAESRLAAMREAVNNYTSRFAGWSIYSVDGVFFDRENKNPIEEATQIVRIMFKYESTLEEEAKTLGHRDVIRSITMWCIDRPTALDTEYAWHSSQRIAFLEHHHRWPDEKRDFAERYFEGIAREVACWKSDCGLFIFGYLVHKFSQHLLSQGLREDEIWVTGLWNLAVYITKRTDSRNP